MRGLKTIVSQWTVILVPGGLQRRGRRKTKPRSTKINKEYDSKVPKRLRDAQYGGNGRIFGKVKIGQDFLVTRGTRQLPQPRI